MAGSPTELLREHPDAVIVLDRELCYAFVNARASAWVGRAEESLLGARFDEVPVPGTEPATVEAYRQALRTGEAAVLDQLHPPLDRFLEHRMAPVGGHLWVTLRDVSEEKREEETLRRKAVVFDAAGDILIVTDPDGLITGWNPAAEATLGYDAPEMKGRPITELFSAPDAEEKVRAVISEVTGADEWSGEIWVARKDGTRRLLESRVRAVRDRSGRMIGTVGVSRDVTERQEAGEELAALLRAMHDVVLVIDRTGRYRRVVPIHPELLYRPSQDLVGRRFREVLPAEQAAEFEAAVRTALREDRTVETEYSMRIEGEERWFHAALSPLDADHVVWVARDTTDRKQAMDRLRESEERFRQIAENVRDVFWIADRDLTEFLYVSPGYREVWGSRARELRHPARFLERVHPDHREAVRSAIERALQGESEAVTYPLVQPDGSTTWLSSRVFPVRDEQGAVYRLAGATTDITAHREAEEQRRRAMERLETFLDTIPDQAWMKDVDGRYVVVNEAYADARERDASEILGRTDREIFGPDLGARFSREDETVLQTGERYRTEDEVPTADGGSQWFEVLKAPVRSEAGTVVGTAGIARDITDRKRAEEQVRQQALLFQSTADAVVYTNAEARITAWNQAAEQIFGYRAEEAMGRDIRRLLLSNGDDGGTLSTAIAGMLRARGRWQGELELHRKDGSTATCEAVALPLLDSGGELRGGISVFRDVTRRRSLEEQLRQSQKLEAIGRLAGGIAHDFNNMLLVIQGFASLLEAEIDGSQQATEYLAEIRQAADRSARLTRQLLAYSRKQILQPDLLDLNRSVAGLESMLRRMIGEDVALVTELDDDIGSVRADPSQMEQMLVNLVLNARDAMPTGGRLVIRTRRRAVSADRPAPDLEVPPGNYVEVAVQDSGHGMAEEVLQHVFEPFFTTKPAGEGTGLGLSMVYGIVRQSEGYIWGESEPGKGTTFRVLLPSVDEPHPAADADARNADAPGSGATAAQTPPGEPGSNAGTVLVVEDERSVRDLFERVLRRGGFSVLSAADGAQALALADATPRPLDLAILDVVLPGMSGREVADALSARRPELPILFVSGYTDDHVLRHGISRAERHFLQKPVQPAALLARVRELIPPLPPR